jgi:hypothetical protein
MPVFYEIASIKSGNRYINNFLTVISNKGRTVATILYVLSISHNIVKQGLTSVDNICTPPGGMMRVSITVDDEVRSLSPATHHQLLQLLGWRGYSVVIWEISRSENDLPRLSNTRRCNLHGRESSGTVMHQRQYLETFLD